MYLANDQADDKGPWTSFLSVCLFFKFCIFDFSLLFFVFVNMTIWEKKLQTTSPMKSRQQIQSLKFMHTSREGICQSCIKIDEMSNLSYFGFLPIFVLFLRGGGWSGGVEHGSQWGIIKSAIS